MPYYVAPETPMILPVIADCPDFAPPYFGQVLRIERIFVENLKIILFTAAADFLDRRRAATADQNLPARRRRHHDVGARLYVEGEEKGDGHQHGR